MEIKHTFKLKSSAKEVFEAMATRRGVMNWWSKKCEVGERAGEKSRLLWMQNSFEMNMVFRTDVLTPNNRVLWTCIDGVNPAWIGTVLELQINEMDKDVIVEFVHSNFNNKWSGQDWYEDTKADWKLLVEKFIFYCESKDAIAS